MGGRSWQNYRHVATVGWIDEPKQRLHLFGDGGGSGPATGVNDQPASHWRQLKEE